MDQTKVSSIDFTSLVHLERFRQIKFIILDALAAMMWGENDTDDVNNTPIGKNVRLQFMGILSRK